MSDLLRIDLAAARSLVGSYRFTSHLVDHSRRGLGPLLADAAGRVPSSTDAAEGVRLGLEALQRLLDRSADDLEWRVDYVAALGTTAGVALPRRPASLRSVTELLGLIDDDDADVGPLLDELVFHALTDPTVAAQIARRLDGDLVRRLHERVVAELQRDVGLLGPGGTFHRDPAGRIDAVEDLIDHADRLLDPLGVLMATMSHHADGRAAILDAWDHPGGGDGIHLMPLALRAGVWDADFVLMIAEDVLTDRDLHGLGSRLPLVHYETSLAAWPELLDPVSIVLAAVGRNPEAARRWIEHHDGFWRVVSDPSFPGPFTAGGGWINHGRDRDAALAAILAALDDGAPPGWIESALRGSYTPGRDRTNDGILYAVEAHGLLGYESAVALADLLVGEWDRLVSHDPGVTVPTTLAGPAFAAVMESDEGMARLMAGYAMHLEHVFAQAYMPDANGQIDLRAVEEATAAAAHGFELLDAGLDGRDVGTDRHVLARDAFSLFLGHGAKAAISRVAVPGTLPFTALSFAADQVVDAVATQVFPYPAEPESTSQSVLEDLFIGGKGAPGASVGQPAPGEILLANALLAGDPTMLDDLDASRFIVDGTVAVPTDATHMDGFATWFHDTFYDDPGRRELVYGTAESLSVVAARVATD